VRSEQSAENFIHAIDVAFESICSYPTRWRNKYKDFYELGVKKYPYTIIYLIDNQNKLIIIHSYFTIKGIPLRNIIKRFKQLFTQCLTVLNVICFEWVGVRLQMRGY
jgi:hypothetical protein